MLVKLILTGYLKDFVPKGEIIVDAFNARDALMKAGNYLPKGATHQVQVSELACVDSLQENHEVLTIQPLYQGSGGSNKKAGGIQIALGILLVAFSGGIAGLGLGLSKGAVILTGAQLILGGALQLLQKSPKADPIQGDKKSRFINGEKNTVKEGTPIPLIYGRQKVYPHVLSFNIDSSDYNPNLET